MGGLNGFEIHKDDGFLYGPLWFKGQVVKINLETGGIEVIADGFKTPAAANIDPQNRDNVYVVDTGTGGIWSVSLTSKAKKLVASMKPGLDNLAFDSRGRLFVTSMTDNGIYLVDKQTGAHKTIVEGKLAIPADLAVTTENGKDTVHVADVFSYRTVDGQTGAIGQPHGIQQLHHARTPFGCLDIAQQHRQFNILVCRQHRYQRKELENKADLFAAQIGALIGVEACHILPLNLHRALIGFVQAADQLQQRCLAGTRWTHERRKLAFADAQIDIVQRVCFGRADVIRFADVFKLNSIHDGPHSNSIPQCIHGFKPSRIPRRIQRCQQHDQECGDRQSRKRAPVVGGAHRGADSKASASHRRCLLA